MFLSHRIYRSGVVQNSIRTIRKKPANDVPLAQTSNILKYSILGTGAMAGAGLCYTLKNALIPRSDSNLVQAATWPDYVKTRINGTFSYVLGGLGFTVGGAALTLRSRFLMNLMTKNSMIAFFGCIAAMWGTGYICQATPFNGSPVGLKALLYYLHMGVVGSIIAPMALLGGEACLLAGGLTAAVMAGLSLTAMVAPSDAYVGSYGMINAGMMLMLGACVASFFVNPANSMAGMGIYSFILFGGLALFSYKGFADVQRAIDHAKAPGGFDPINHAVHISMDAINIFIRLVQIIAMAKNNKK